MIDLRPATQATAAVIAALSDDHLALPTPRPEYSVGDLLDHVEGLALAFTDAAAETPSTTTPSTKTPSTGAPPGGWDLARATGQDFHADDSDVAVCIETMGPQPGEERPVGTDVAFGRPVEAADDAGPVDRLAAVLGRDPAWRGAPAGCSSTSS